MFIVPGGGDVPKLSAGFEEQLEDIINEIKPSLVAVDVLQKVRIDRQLAYSTDYGDLSILQEIATRHHICLLVVTHTRKQQDIADVFNMVSGTTGITGTCDTMLAMTGSKRFADRVTLSVTGRDIKGGEYVLQFNNYRWHNLGDTETIRFLEFQAHPITQTLQKLLAQNEKWSGSASLLLDSAEALGYDTFDINSTHAGRFISNHKRDLRKIGIDVAQRRLTRERLYTFKKCDGKLPL